MQHDNHGLIERQGYITPPASMGSICTGSLSLTTASSHGISQSGGIQRHISLAFQPRKFKV